MTENNEPLLIPSNYRDLSGFARLDIVRPDSSDDGDWADCWPLIEGVLREDEAIEDCAVDYDGSVIIVALSANVDADGYYYFTVEDMVELQDRILSLVSKACQAHSFLSGG